MNIILMILAWIVLVLGVQFTSATFMEHGHDGLRQAMIALIVCMSLGLTAIGFCGCQLAKKPHLNQFLNTAFALAVLFLIGIPLLVEGDQLL